MTREELQSAVADALSSLDFAQDENTVLKAIAFEEGGQFLNGAIARENLIEVIATLRDKLGFNYLFCLTCVDYKTHFTMFYHLRNLDTFDELVVKVKIEDVDHPAIDSVTGLYQTANFHEREVYDLFGVKFYGHPDLRRIFLDENWPGYPLRKSYVDPNMIEL
jgi:NADH-quinone oxidoreductase subunit C